MRKHFLAMQFIAMSFAVNAAAGGVDNTNTCTFVNTVMASTPMEVYLPDGWTTQTVGKASIVSRKASCQSGEYEMLDVQLNLDDEIKPYGLKIKDTVTMFENESSFQFRLKELVNSTDYFNANLNGKIKINHFGSLGTLNVELKAPDILFWTKTQSSIDSVMTAQTSTDAEDRPLACSLETAFVRITKKANGTNGLEKDLILTAIFPQQMQLCP